MKNCILLPIVAESQDTALRIFSTLNDRGKPLSDADIFKAQFYKYFSSKGEKDSFIAKWKDLEVLCDSLFHPISGTPMDELFTRYMYYERAKQGIKSSTTEALRKFYERNSYALLKTDETFENLIDLANFWNDVQNQSVERFSDRIFLFHTPQLQNAFNNYTFSNNRAITKSMLTWWAFQDPGQELLSLESVLEIEHIYARNRQEKEHSLTDARNVESLGNKALLEKRINIRAADYRFSDKVKYYLGFENSRKQKKEGTKIKELVDLATNATDFTETDIVQRKAKILFKFHEFMGENGLLSVD